MGSTGNLVLGNYIGIDMSGGNRLDNLKAGVAITSGASNNTIGGATPDARNIISENEGDGVDIRGANTSGNMVEGNRIGTDFTGMNGLGNLLDGVAISNGASGNTIGGSVSGAGNLISENRFGITIEVAPGDTAVATGNLVEGNSIGTNASGNEPLGNLSHGVVISNCPGNTVGGMTPASRNLISGNFGYGLSIQGSQATGNLVEGNFIGTKASGSGLDLNGFPLPFLSNLQGGIQIENWSHRKRGRWDRADGSPETLSRATRPLASSSPTSPRATWSKGIISALT